PHANMQPASPIPTAPSRLAPPPTTTSQVAFYETYTYYFGTLQNSWVGGDASCVRIRTGAPAHQPQNGKAKDPLCSPYFYNERFSVDDLPVDLMHLVGDLLEKKEREEGGTWIVCSMRLVPRKVFSIMLGKLLLESENSKSKYANGMGQFKHSIEHLWRFIRGIMVPIYI